MPEGGWACAETEPRCTTSFPQKPTCSNLAGITLAEHIAGRAGPEGKDAAADLVWEGEQKVGAHKTAVHLSAACQQGRAGQPGAVNAAPSHASHLHIQQHEHAVFVLHGPLLDSVSCQLTSLRSAPHAATTLSTWRLVAAVPGVGAEGKAGHWAAGVGAHANEAGGREELGGINGLCKAAKKAMPLKSWANRQTHLLGGQLAQLAFRPLLNTVHPQAQWLRPAHCAPHLHDDLRLV